MRDSNAVIRHGHALFCAVPQAILHFPLTQHTAAAVNSERIAAQILGKLTAGGKFELYILSGKAADPVRQFFRADVTALSVMRAALGDEHRIAIL